MHIAVLVYGRLNKCAEHYTNIVESIGMHNRVDFFVSSDNSSETLLNDFVGLYNPILYNNSAIRYDYDLGKYPGRRGETDIHNMTCHLINKNRVFELLEEYINKKNIQYDCVVSLRVDAVFKDKFDFTMLEENTIYIPHNFDYVDYGINDQIAFGTVDVMKKYNSINAVELLEKQLSIPHPESLHYSNIHYHKLNITRVPLNYYLDK
jgi:hypothetical protein